MTVVKESDKRKWFHPASFIAGFVALAIVNGAVQKHTVNLGNAYYAVLILAILLSFFQSDIRKLSATMLWIYFVCILSIVVNNIPPQYMVWQRFGLFCAVTVLVSPFIQSDFMDKFRVLLFKYVNILIIIVILLSIPKLISGERGITGFEGFTSHSMLLGIISSYAIITICYNIYIGRAKNILLYPLLIISFILLLMSASRICLTSTIVASLYFLYRINKNNITNFVKIAIIIVSVSAVSFPLWDHYLEDIEKKNTLTEADIEAGRDLTKSRETLWNQRLDEFASSPITGIGFCYAPYASNYDRTEFIESKDGVIEPGSAWLGIMSMTGILGILGVIVLWGRSFVMLFKVDNKDTAFAAYLGALLVFWTIHMFAEGGIYSAGGFECIMQWTLLGTIQSSYNIYYKNRF